MDIFSHFHAKVSAALTGAYPEVSAELLQKFVVEPPRDPGHGDLSTNAAMVVAKHLGKAPREIAAALMAGMTGDPDIVSVDIAGPGFINFRITEALWFRILAAALKPDFGKTDIGHGEKVNVEYVSANPTGPMHVGHTRGAVYGDALARLLDFAGYEVTREYYINDAGSQVDVLARSAFLRYREALGEVVEIPRGFYPGDYLIPVGQALAAEYAGQLRYKDESEWLPLVKAKTLSMMMDLIRADLLKLGIRHDVFFSEKSLHDNGVIAETLEWLRGQGLVYQGKLDRPKGIADHDDWEDREQTLFRATQFGDDTDRALLKSDGSYTYFAADIAYHRNKYLRGFRHMIVVLGADHSGYLKRLDAAVKAVSAGEADIDVKFCQLVRLLKNGEPFKMSKRSGDLVTVADVVDEVGSDATRFMMLFRKNDAPLDFDFDKVKEQSRDNPVFYVQYAHARARSVFRAAERDMPGVDISDAAVAGADLTQLTSPHEIELIKLIAQWPRTVAQAAVAHEPHRIAFYLHELAAAFHGLWARGNEDATLRFVNPTAPMLTLARLGLVAALRQVLANGLEVLGVNAPSELS